ncbi:hypothetical protein [Fusobacterium ulcerans]|uniref:hypothetical protein n=1 Tax=Fusobacterium ulcerans TaxID=861 RepID=UPI001D09F0C0|nr:hypothetical protein [Fusobacterium ulcerans]MCB8564485.1 hypothetical protein [Fusobacterium ulcerans]MCB8648656.1 hypothetical protein [Fusobacterium ulcerans]
MSSDKQNENTDIKEEKLTRKEYYRLKRDEFNKKIMEEVKKERQKEQRVFVDIVKKSVEANKIQDIKEADNVVMVYGLFELFSKMTDEEKKKLKKRSKEIEEVFLAERKARNKKKEEENLEAEVGNGE